MTTADNLQCHAPAAEDLPAWVLVTANGRRADSASSAHFGHVLGMTTEATRAGQRVKLINAGLVTCPAWRWSYGDAIFLSGTALSATPPEAGFSQQIGQAQSEQSIIIELKQPVWL